MNEKLMFNQYFLLNSYYPDLYPNDNNPGFSGDEVRSGQGAGAAERSRLAGGHRWHSGQGWRAASRSSILHYEQADLRHLNIYMEQLKAVGHQGKPGDRLDLHVYQAGG